MINSRKHLKGNKKVDSHGQILDFPGGEECGWYFQIAESIEHENKLKTFTPKTSTCPEHLP